MTFQRFLFVILITCAFLGSGVTEMNALSRDYLSFYTENGEVWVYDIKPLDGTNDVAFIHEYLYCPRHFDFGYNWTAKDVLPPQHCKFSKSEQELTNLLPRFQIAGESLSEYTKKGFTCFKDCNTIVNGKRITYRCGLPTCYAGYLDYDFWIYNSQLFQQLQHVKYCPNCVCFWPELSVHVAEISDVAYEQFQQLFTSTALSQLIDNSYEQWYLIQNYFWELNLHGLCVSCVARAFWFSHYYQVCANIFRYAHNECYAVRTMSEKQLKQIRTKLHSTLRLLAIHFYPIYLKCFHQHPTKEIHQEIEFLLGFYPDLVEEGCEIYQKHESRYVSEIKKIGSCSQNLEKQQKEPKASNSHNPHSFLAEFYLIQGLGLNDRLRYKEAIELLNKSIQLDNSNRIAYLARAHAQFELLNFQAASIDYLKAKSLTAIFPFRPRLSWEEQETLNPFIPKEKKEFAKGYALGFMRGFNVGSRSFLPSILHTVTGVGRGLWHYGKKPVQVSHEFLTGAATYISLLRENLAELNLKNVPPELNILLEKWVQLSDFKKGEHLGYVIGKYGIDILLWCKTIEQIHRFRDLKYANSALTFEACEQTAQRKLITEEAEKHSFSRSRIYKDGKVKFHWGHQDKHFRGTKNFEKGRSYFTISKEKLVQLCEELLGTGEAVIEGTCLGDLGYKERIDFGEVVGQWVSKESPSMHKATSIGIVHYRKDGFFHVIPGFPQ